MIKNTILLSLLTVLISGCSTSGINTENKMEKKYIKYDNTNHIIGKKSEAIKTLSYNEIINNKQDVKITFYIDKFPYIKKFNLCKDKQTYKRLKSVAQMKNSSDKLEYETIKIDCNGYIEIFKNHNNNIIGNYSFTLLKGFNINRSLKYDILFEETVSKTGMNSSFTEILNSNEYKEPQEFFWDMK